MCSDRFIVSLFVYWISRPRDNRNLIIAARSFRFHDNFAPIRCDTGTFHLLDAINYLFVCGRDKGIFRFFLICWKLREERNPPKSNCELWKRHWKSCERREWAIRVWGWSWEALKSENMPKMGTERSNVASNIPWKPLKWINWPLNGTGSLWKDKNGVKTGLRALCRAKFASNQHWEPYKEWNWPHSRLESLVRC